MASAKQTLKTFFEEKNLPYQMFEIDSADGVHIIDNETVIDIIVNQASAHEQKGILDMIVRIDFVNGNVNDYLKHLATGLVS